LLSSYIAPSLSHSLRPLLLYYVSFTRVFSRYSDRQRAGRLRNLGSIPG
jgi:hypothetical protein